ncbi:MAG: carboxylesterase family protein [Planctomycetota bacterium]|nr:carboxylesterase family protein [Planctomycetota bacterium]
MAPPQRVNFWKGIRNCTKFGPDCWQRSNNPKAQMSEDCLSLNVWTTNTQGNQRFPVMVWIHGDGLNSGSSSRYIYSGSELALHKVVVVSLNYRLGRLGYLAHPALSNESPHNVSGNYGFLDQIAALKWVQQNISQFGGDPNNATVFGEFAGGTSITVLASSPLAKGLFQRAIIRSAWMFGYSDSIAEPCILPLRQSVGTFSTTEQEGREFAAAAVNATGAKAIARLRALSAKELYEVKTSYRQRATIDGFLFARPSGSCICSRSTNRRSYVHWHL